MDSQTSSQRLNQIKSELKDDSVFGYVVNIHDCLNIDIDFDIKDNPNLTKLLESAYNLEYTYLDNKDSEITSNVYRCRIYEIGSNYSKHDSSSLFKSVYQKCF